MQAEFKLWFDKNNYDPEYYGMLFNAFRDGFLEGFNKRDMYVRMSILEGDINENY